MQKPFNLFAAVENIYTPRQRYVLLDMTEISEVLPVPTMLTIPLTQEWYRGVANIRGNLHSVTDLSRFTGQEPVPAVAGARLLLVQPRLLENTALLVNHIVGLRNPEQLGQQLAPPKDGQEWVSDRYRDDQGVEWEELELEKLIRHPQFLQINQIGLTQ